MDSERSWASSTATALAQWALQFVKPGGERYSFFSLSDRAGAGAAGPNPYDHWHSINWFSGLIPRMVVPQDLLFSFGAFMTICRIQRNDAEARV